MSSRTVRLANKNYGVSVEMVTDDQTNDKLKAFILNEWNIHDSRDFFPAPQPVSLERRDIRKLMENEYLVCAKSDGMRFLMFCYEGITYMIDRAFKFYEIDIRITEEIFAIFDGELVLNKQIKWQYVIHDCINFKGTSISKLTFPKRLEYVNTFVEMVKDDSVISVMSKQFFPLEKLGHLNELINEDKFDHKTDGIILTPKLKGVGIHTQYDLFKWKPRHLHTFDFKIINNGEIGAFVNKNGTHILYASAPKGSNEEKSFLEGLVKNCPEFINGMIIECEYDDTNDLFIPVKSRQDKIHPNSLSTVRKTLCNIKENITIEELIEMSKHK
jgi:mRNA guanylyltransferase